ncbi:MAG: HAD-IA family hydrolase, partial [Nocardioidaceae bacterium]
TGSPVAPPAAVVFDLGNVLIGWDPLPAVAAGVGTDEALRFLSADDFDFMAWNHHQDAGRDWAQAEAEVAERFPHWHRHACAYRAHFAASLTGALEDHVAVLRDLHAAGVPVYALTNWSAELFPVARRRFDFLALFDDIVVSGQERLAKPDPRVFSLLAARVGHPLAECVFADDSAANVAAARAAGLDAVHVAAGTDLRAELAARGLPVGAAQVRTAP